MNAWGDTSNHSSSPCAFSLIELYEALSTTQDLGNGVFLPGVPIPQLETSHSPHASSAKPSEASLDHSF